MRAMRDRHGADAYESITVAHKATLGRDVGAHADIMQGKFFICPNQLQARALEGARDVVPLSIDCDVSLQAVPHDIGFWLRIGWEGKGWHGDMPLSRPAQKDRRVDLQDGQSCGRLSISRHPWRARRKRAREHGLYWQQGRGAPV